MDQPNSLSILLTGATGFLGTSILLDLKHRVDNGQFSSTNTNANTLQLYLPIRSMKDQTGQERCQQLCQDLGLLDSPGMAVTWIDPTLSITESWPRDIAVVIFCAFDTKFERPFGEMFSSSVKPMVEALRTLSNDDRRHRWPLISSIVVVSTAFVQPPLPFRRKNHVGNVNEWAPRQAWNGDPVAVYESFFKSLLEGKGEEALSMESNRQILSKLHDHTLSNSYIFSKTLIETLLQHDPQLQALREQRLLTVVRPSIVGASFDGTQYSVTSPACAGLLVATNQIIGRGIPYWGSVDLVTVCSVAKTIVNVSGVLDRLSNINQKLRFQKNQGNTEEINIQYATNGVPYSMLVLNASCGKWFSFAASKTTKPYIQAMECNLLALLKWNRKAGAHLASFYKVYDYFTSNTWDFPPVFAVDFPKYFMLCHDKQKQRKMKKKKLYDTAGDKSSIDNKYFDHFIWMEKYFAEIKHKNKQKQQKRKNKQKQQKQQKHKNKQKQKKHKNKQKQKTLE